MGPQSVAGVDSREVLGPTSTPDEVTGWVRDNMAAFLAQSVNPGAADRDRDEQPLPRTAFRRAADLGLLGYLLPRELGGSGGDRRTYGLILEQMGYFGDEIEYGSLLSLYADIPTVIAETGRPDLIERYVVPMSQGHRFGTFAYTERTDPFDLACRVTTSADGYVLDGEKCLQTGGWLADVFLTYVRSENDDLQVFLVERTDPGVVVEPVPTAGFRAAGLTRLALHQVTLPPERLLVRVDGLSHAQRFLNHRRLFVVCPMVGRMKALIESCATHLTEVVRYGRPLTQHQAVQAKLGRMVIRYEGARALLHDALARWAGTHNPLHEPVVSAAKYTIVDNAIAVALDAVGLTGWLGYSRELPFERYLRGFMAGIAGQTAQDVLELLLGDEVIARTEFARQIEGAIR